MKLLLADEKLLNSTNGTARPPTRGQTLDQAIDNLSNAVQNGDLSEIPLLVGNTEIMSQMLSVWKCTDALCNSTDVKQLATAPPPMPSSAEKPVLFMQLHLISITTMMIICLLMKM